MAIDALSVTLQGLVTWRASVTLAGTGGTATSNNSSRPKSLTYSDDTANAALGGADTFANFVQTISAGSSVTVDLQSLTNILGQSGTSFARVKGWLIQLLAVADDATYGTACSGCTLGNTGEAVANAAQLNFGSGSGLLVDITTAAGALSTVAIGTAGSGYPRSSCFTATVTQGAATGGVITVITNASGVPTTVAIVAGFVGSGYSNASGLATVVQSWAQLKTGSLQQYFDRTAAGFTLSATVKNVRFQNQDGAVAAALMITAVGGTS